MRPPGLPWTRNKSIISAIPLAWMFRFSYITAIACRTLNELLFFLFSFLFFVTLESRRKVLSYGAEVC